MQPFNELNLTEYYSYINTIINERGQFNIESGKYYEVHHIIPKCYGGKPAKITHTSKHENLIWLYPEEHYRAHEILAVNNINSMKLVFAFNFMCNRQEDNSIQISCEDYKKLKEAYNKYNSEINTGKISPMRGKHYSQEVRDKVSLLTKQAMARPEVKEKLSASSKGRAPWNKGLTGIYSQETLNKLSLAKKGQTLSEETKNKIGLAQKGKIVSTETRIKISNSQSKEKCKHNRKVICVDTSEIFYNIRFAAEKLNLNHSNITQCCKGKRFSVGGLKFKYYED